MEILKADLFLLSIIFQQFFHPTVRSRIYTRSRRKLIFKWPPWIFMVYSWTWIFMLMLFGPWNIHGHELPWIFMIFPKEEYSWWPFNVQGKFMVILEKIWNFSWIIWMVIHGLFWNFPCFFHGQESRVLKSNPRSHNFKGL